MKEWRRTEGIFADDGDYLSPNVRTLSRNDRRRRREKRGDGRGRKLKGSSSSPRDAHVANRPGPDGARRGEKGKEGMKASGKPSTRGGSGADLSKRGRRGGEKLIAEFLVLEIKSS